MKINKRKSNKTEHANTTQNERKKSTEIPEYIFCWSAAPGYGTYPETWSLCLAKASLKKIDFPFANHRQLLS